MITSARPPAHRNGQAEGVRHGCLTYVYVTGTSSPELPLGTPPEGVRHGVPDLRYWLGQCFIGDFSKGNRLEPVTIFITTNLLGHNTPQHQPARRALAKPVALFTASSVSATPPGNFGHYWPKIGGRSPFSGSVGIGPLPKLPKSVMSPFPAPLFRPPPFPHRFPVVRRRLWTIIAISYGGRES